MRTLPKTSMDTEKANEAVRSGKMQELIQGLMEQLKREAAYFTVAGGVRTVYVVFGRQDSSRMPVIGERFFLDMNAALDLTPVMNAEDLKKGLSGLR